MTSPRSWAGEIILGPGWLHYAGPVLSTDRHAHHAVQIVQAEAPIIFVGDDHHSVSATAAIIGANTPHELRAPGNHAELTYVEPRLVRTPSGGGPSDWVRRATVLVGPPGPNSVETQVNDLVSKIGGGSFRHGDTIVLAAMAEVRSLLPGSIRLVEIASAVGLSPSRLTHRFTTAQGIPLSRWVLWERLQLAARSLAEGGDLTTAAHRAGFTDSSHLHRTFRSMFGVAPSDVSGAVRWSVVA